MIILNYRLTKIIHISFLRQLAIMINWIRNSYLVYRIKYLKIKIKREREKIKNSKERYVKKYSCVLSI